MNRMSMILALWVCTLAASPATAQAEKPIRADDPARTVREWRDALELELPGVVLAQGKQLPQRLRAQGEAVALFARALDATGDTAAARALLEGAQVDESTQHFIELERARIALQNDALGEVVERLVRAGKPRYPTEPDCLIYLARALTRAGQGSKADALLLRFVELAPQHEAAASAWHMLAQRAIQQRDGAKASEYRARAEQAARWQSYYKARRIQLRENPEARLPRLGLAQLWLEARDFKRAEGLLLELIQRDPTFAKAWTHLAEARRELGNKGGAREAYDRALELDPSDTLARHNRGVLLEEAGELEAAQADYTVLVESKAKPDEATRHAFLLLARLLERQGDATRARELHERYVELGGKEALTPPE